MNKYLLAASCIALLTALIHIFMGGADTVAPLQQSTLADIPKYTLYAVWHMTSVCLMFSAVGLFLGSLKQHTRQSHYLVIFISLLWITFGLTFLLITLLHPDHVSVFQLPQWILLLPVGILGVWGSVKTSLNT